MIDTIRVSLALTVVCMLAGLAAGFTYSRTKGMAERRAEETRREALAALFPEGTVIAAREGAAPLPPRYWIATKGNRTVGYAFTDTAPGYAGSIEVLVGTSTDGTVLGLQIVSQRETPGLGGRIAERAEPFYRWRGSGPVVRRPWFSEQFTGLTIMDTIGIVRTGEWSRLTNEERGRLVSDNSITAVAGATESTRAVVRAVTRSIPRYVACLSSPGRRAP